MDLNNIITAFMKAVDALNDDGMYVTTAMLHIDHGKVSIKIEAED